MSARVSPMTHVSSSLINPCYRGSVLYSIATRYRWQQNKYKYICYCQIYLLSYTQWSIYIYMVYILIIYIYFFVLYFTWKYLFLRLLPHPAHLFPSLPLSLPSFHIHKFVFIGSHRRFLISYIYFIRGIRIFLSFLRRCCWMTTR